MRRLAGEPNHVTLDPKRAEHHAGRFLHRFEHGTLFDVELEVRARVDGLQLALSVEHTIEDDTVFGERVDQASALSILQLSYLVDVQAAGGGGGSQETPSK